MLRRETLDFRYADADITHACISICGRIAVSYGNVGSCDYTGSSSCVGCGFATTCRLRSVVEDSSPMVIEESLMLGKRFCVVCYVRLW